MWKNSPKFDDLVRYCWQEEMAGNKMFVVNQKLKKVKKKLKELNKADFLEFHADVIKTATAMEDIQRRMHDDPSNIDLVDEEI